MSLIKVSRKRLSEFLGHITRKEQLEKIATGKIEGKRGRRISRLPPLRSKKVLQ